MTAPQPTPKPTNIHLGLSDVEEAQLRASDPFHSVWVNASAGSGKTTVLTKRVLRLLLSDVAPYKILCLTYTRAAAAEMIVRLMQRLGAWAICSDDTLRNDLDDLQKQPPTPQQLKIARQLFVRVLNCPGGLRIRTIHAFAQEILGRFPIEAGLPPHFTLVTDWDKEELVQQALINLLRDAEGNDQSILGQSLARLAIDIGEDGIKTLVKEFLGNRDRLSAFAANPDMLNAIVACQCTALGLRPADNRDDFISAALAETPCEKLREAGLILQKGSVREAKFASYILGWLAEDDGGRKDSFSTYTDHFFNDDDEPKAILVNETKKKHPWIDELLAGEAARLSRIREKLAAFDAAITSADAMVIGLHFLKNYDALKKQSSALDYDDLILATRNLLNTPGVAPWVLYKLDGGIDHILLDEAQDTSRAQWDIIAALTDEFFTGDSKRPKRTLFVVGDEKQSIYSFQNADPAAFYEMHNYFAKRLNDIGQELVNVGLTTSFRSAPAILRAVDDIFAKSDASEGVSHTPIHHKAAITKPGQGIKSGTVALWPMTEKPKKEKSTTPDLWAAPDAYEEGENAEVTLAENLARYIAELLKNPPTFYAQNRAIGAGDIMILLSRRGRMADILVRTLKKHGVPVSGIDRMQILSPLVVQDLLSVFQFALLQDDDLNLAALLKSPLIGFDDDDLIALCPERKGSLWHHLQQQAHHAPRWQSATNYLQSILAQTDRDTPFALLSFILDQPSANNRLSGRKALLARLGPDALDPMDELLSVAATFSQTHVPSLQEFMHWISASNSELKREQDQAGDYVRVMTVHAAKGLEAPIVFLADMAQPPDAQKTPKLLWHGETPFYIPRKATIGLSGKLWKVARKRQLEEHRRLFYVAMTRAAQNLIILGALPGNRNSPKDTWYELAENGLSTTTGITPPPPARVCITDPTPLSDEKSADLVAAAQTSSKVVELPNWVFENAPEERKSVSLMPSRLDDAFIAAPDAAFERGRIIHRLLQILPDLPQKLREDAARNFLANPQHQLAPTAQKLIAGEVIAILAHPQFSDLFGPESRAEVPLIGHVKGQHDNTIISGQIDRLVVRGNEVWVIDYKTNRPPPKNPDAVPMAYIKQMAAYVTLLGQIYEGKTIRCFLLWTYGPHLMELPTLTPPP